MAAIAMAESSGDTDVVNSIGCVGLWQINQPVHVKTHPRWTVKWLQNPLNNAAAAKEILKSQGLGAWEVYTGPDGTGSDGPYRDYIDKPIDTNASVADWNPFDGDVLPDSSDIPGLDGLSAVGEALEKTADVLVNPQTWLRVAYGVVGVILVTGGLFLILKNSPAVRSAESNIKAIAGVASKAKTKATTKAKAKPAAKPAPEG
jgi:hypothetical protein